MGSLHATKRDCRTFHLCPLELGLWSSAFQVHLQVQGEGGGMIYYLPTTGASPVGLTVKNLPSMTGVQSLGREDLLEKRMTTHSSILAWRIPRTEELGMLQSMGSQSQTPLSDSDFHFFFQAGASGAIEIRATNCPRWLVQQGEKGSGTLALSSRMFCSFQVDQA